MIVVAVFLLLLSLPLLVIHVFNFGESDSDVQGVKDLNPSFRNGIKTSIKGTVNQKKENKEGYLSNEKQPASLITSKRVEKELNVNDENEERTIKAAKDGVNEGLSVDSLSKGVSQKDKLEELSVNVLRESKGSQPRPITITTQTIKGEFNVLFFTNRPIKEYQSFLLSSPPRFVIDLTGTWKSPDYTELRLINQKVKSIRIGEHPNKIRIVMDLKSDKGINPTIKQTPRGLVCTLK